MKRIAIFASGEGTNAQNIINHFKGSSSVRVTMIISNNPSANVINRANQEGVKSLLINKDNFYKSETVIKTLQKSQIDLIVLAGFLWMIPENLITAFPNKIINIHPALLPKFGGKGMYGMNVHRAVIEAKEPKSGISIHYVNEHYDEGELIKQYECEVGPTDTPENVAEKIHQLEMKYFPLVIDSILQ